MTVPVGSRNDYVGVGTVAVYAFTFKVFDEGDLLVTVRDTDDVERALVLGADYLVSPGSLEFGGTITLDDPLALDWALTIQRVVPLSQDTDIRNQSSLHLASIEDALDMRAMVDQQQQDEIGRSLKGPVTQTGFDFTIPPTIPGGVLRVKLDGTGLEWTLDVGGGGSPTPPPPGGVAEFPVGSVLILRVPTHPVVLLGYGTWVEEAQGQALVGRLAGDPDFGTGLAVVGGKTVTLTEAHLAPHTHGQQPHTHGQDPHTHAQLSHGHGLAAHTHPVVDPGHGHPVTDAGHAHPVFDPTHGHPVEDPGHAHPTDFGTGIESLATGSGPAFLGGASATGPAGTGIAVGAGPTGVGVLGAVTGISVGGAGTGITVGAAAGAVDAALAVNQAALAVNHPATAVSLSAGSGVPVQVVQPSKVFWIWARTA